MRVIMFHTEQVPKEVWCYCLLAIVVAKVWFWCIFCWPVLFFSEHRSFWVLHRMNLKLHKTSVGFNPGKLSNCFPLFTFDIRNEQSLKISYMQEYLKFFLYLTSLLPLAHVCLIATSFLLQSWNIGYCWLSMLISPESKQLVLTNHPASSQRQVILFRGGQLRWFAFWRTWFYHCPLTTEGVMQLDN